MKRIFILCLFFLSSNVYSKPYWTAEEYFLIYQGQKTLTSKMQVIASNEVDTDIKNIVMGETLRIIAVEPSNQLSNYWISTQQEIVERLKKYGVIVEFESRSTSLGSEEIQTRQLIDAVKKRPDYLLMNADSKQEQSVLTLLLSEIPDQKIVVDNLTTPIRGLRHQPFLYAGFDNYHGGYLIGKYYRAKGYKTVLGLCLKRGLVSEQRLAGFESGYGNYLSDVIHFDGSVSSILADEQYIRSKIMQIKPDALFACDSDIALTTATFPFTKEIALNGLGGVPEEMDALKTKSLLAVSYRIGNIGTAIADAMVYHLAGKETPKIVLGSWRLEE